MLWVNVVGECCGRMFWANVVRNVVIYIYIFIYIFIFMCKFYDLEIFGSN